MSWRPGPACMPLRSGHEMLRFGDPGRQEGGTGAVGPHSCASLIRLMNSHKAVILETVLSSFEKGPLGPPLPFLRWEVPQTCARPHYLSLLLNGAKPPQKKAPVCFTFTTPPPFTEPHAAAGRWGHLAKRTLLCLSRTDSGPEGREHGGSS